MSLRERIAFWRQFRKEFASTGAIQPSSRFLAREMTAPMRADPRDGTVARQIVEMGPGTGAVTRAIAAAMGPRDRLDCYEINAEFARFLESLVSRDEAFASVRDRVRIHCSPAEAAAPEGAVDFVICSIPLNNLGPEAVRRILDTGLDMMEEGWLTYFEYVLLPRLQRPFLGADERRRVDAVAAVKESFRRPGARSRSVLLNLPPARAVHLPAGPETFSRPPGPSAADRRPRERSRSRARPGSRPPGD